MLDVSLHLSDILRSSGNIPSILHMQMQQLLFLIFLIYIFENWAYFSNDQTKSVTCNIHLAFGQLNGDVVVYRVDTSRICCSAHDTIIRQISLPASVSCYCLVCIQANSKCLFQVFQFDIKGNKPHFQICKFRKTRTKINFIYMIFENISHIVDEISQRCKLISHIILLALVLKGGG